MAVNNSTIIDKVWLQGTNDYQQNVPRETQSSMRDVIDFLFDPLNRNYYNQFVDALVNRIGKTIVHNKRWENKLAAFKGANLPYGSTIQEIAPKWIKAHSYEDDDETLLKLNRPEAAAWYHSMNRQERFDISIIDSELRQAFTDEYGLNNFINSVLVMPRNKDNYNEYLCMKQLIAMYEYKWGYYKIQTDAITDEATGKKFLKKARAMAGKLEFPSTLYNAAAITDIPVFASADELILITTPDIDAALDVDTLASVFNLDKAELKYRKVIIDEFPIPGAQALLTTKEWFVVSDIVYETTSFYNPKTLAVNYYLHHWQIVSCSPFVPAILFTTEAGSDTKSAVLNMATAKFTIKPTSATAHAGDDVQLTVSVASAGTSGEWNADTMIVPDSMTFTVSAKDATLNSRTYVDRDNVLHIQKTGVEAGDVLTVTGTSTYVNPSGETTPLTATATITIN